MCVNPESCGSFIFLALAKQITISAQSCLHHRRQTAAAHRSSSLHNSSQHNLFIIVQKITKTENVLWNYLYFLHRREVSFMEMIFLQINVKQFKIFSFLNLQIRANVSHSLTSIR